MILNKYKNKSGKSGEIHFCLIFIFGEILKEIIFGEILKEVIFGEILKKVKFYLWWDIKESKES